MHQTISAIICQVFVVIWWPQTSSGNSFKIHCSVFADSTKSSEVKWLRPLRRYRLYLSVPVSLSLSVYAASCLRGRSMPFPTPDNITEVYSLISDDYQVQRSMPEVCRPLREYDERLLLDRSRPHPHLSWPLYRRHSGDHDKPNMSSICQCWHFQHAILISKQVS